MIHQIRGFILPGVCVLLVGALLLSVLLSPAYLWFAGFTALLLVVGIHDVVQKRHSILRNYPILGHLRFMLEDAGPELHQYLVESNTSGTPFARDQRSLMYERAKNVGDKKPFGTELDVYAEGYSWIAHSLAPKPLAENPSESLRTLVGEGRCEKPYSASVYNISAMSFGALSANAVLSMNAGAKKGGFAHNTGEGGCSRHHRQNGGDLIWQIGTGYFGCRTNQGTFDEETFREQASLDQVKMIEIKLSQGAKPGHGGILPAAKVTEEIAEARRVAVGETCISPPGHSAFDTPIGLLEYVTKLRELSGGKPVGFKLCVGDPGQVFAMCKAMLETKLLPDFITVDGGEGGTGAAPIEFSDHLGAPLRDGLILVHNALVGIGVRDQLRIAASGKRTSGFEIAAAMAMGADWCNSARGFMFSVGCIQAQTCHTNKCPVGVTTQNQQLQRAIDVDDKGKRAFHFHQNTVEALAEVTAAAGLDHPSGLTPDHLWWRLSLSDVRPVSRIYEFFEPGQLLDGTVSENLQPYWEGAQASSW
ncbi:MAG: FMN-binding glutamate synthase family protein [Candidatus Binatia bacterium]|nr:FMN-binding glutamate synthase family protein [Candidatus Binatia bacterium]